MKISSKKMEEICLYVGQSQRPKADFKRAKPFKVCPRVNGFLKVGKPRLGKSLKLERFNKIWSSPREPVCFQDKSGLKMPSGQL
jgi:hypothetical protein